MDLPFTFVTHSAGKLQEVQRIVGSVQHVGIDLPELQAIDVEDVVLFKAKEAFKLLGKPVMIEDTGLYIQNWNGLPGALIKWFVTSVGEPGICQMLQGFPDRRAWAKTAVATYDGIAEPQLFTGRVDGSIAQTPIGNNGFGWDRIFIPDGSTLTFGEMQSDEKDRYSMRRLALVELFKHYARL